MDAESYPWGHLSWSSPSANPSNSASSPQDMPVLDRGWSDPWSLDIHDPQANAEAYSAILDPSFHSTILAIDSAAETPHPDKDFPSTYPSETDTMCPTMISSCISLESTLQGSQGSWSASVNSNEDPRGNIIAEADTNRNLRQGGMSTNSLLDHGRQYTEIRTTPDFSAPSTLPDNYTPPIVVPYQERASTEIPKQSQNLGNGPTAASSSSSLEPSEDRFRCSICGKDFAQKQGVARHRRDVHEVSLCLYCSGFEWHRRHQLKEHLEEQHPDVHLPAELAGVTRYRRRATTKSRLQGKHHYRWSWNEHLSQPLTPPSHPVLEIAHVSSPAVSRVAYDPQPDPASMPTTTNLTRRQVRAPPPNYVDVPSWIN